MSHPLIKMDLVMKVGEAHKILLDCVHNGFPIVNDSGFQIIISCYETNRSVIKQKHFSFLTPPKICTH